MDKNMISICIPTHKFPHSEFYLNRLLTSIREQSYQDYEIIIVRKGKSAAEKLNTAFQEAQGELIKVMFTDDYFADIHALQRIVETHRSNWSITGCIHDDGELINPHTPSWNKHIAFGNNTLGSPSTLTLTNTGFLPRWDPELHWLMDCLYYHRLFQDYGVPQLIDEINIIIGLHENQQTNILSNDIKIKELEYVQTILA
jgi:hypothetical protein